MSTATTGFVAERPATVAGGGEIDRLVRAPRALIADIVRGRFELRALARATLLVTLVCGVAYGLVLGTHRGGAQVAFCAIKVPMLLLATLVVSTPAFVALARALERRSARNPYKEGQITPGSVRS